MIHLLQGKALLSVQKTCYACNGKVALERYDQSKDGYRWWMLLTCFYSLK